MESQKRKDRGERILQCHIEAGFHKRDVYRSDFKNWDFGCAKAPDLTYRQCLNIYNIEALTIDQLRELSRCPNPIFEVTSV